MQFTELNRYKNLLFLITNIRHKPFLIAYGRNITNAIKVVQKSKIKEMKNTQQWLGSLLKLVEDRIVEIRDKPLTPLVGKDSASVYS